MEFYWLRAAHMRSTSQFTTLTATRRPSRLRSPRGADAVGPGNPERSSAGRVDGSGWRIGGEVECATRRVAGEVRAARKGREDGTSLVEPGRSREFLGATDPQGSLAGSRRVR